MIKTKFIRIADLKPGMKIKSANEAGDVVFKTVTKVWNTIVPQEEQVRVEFENGTVVHCSVNHPFMIWESGGIQQCYPTELTSEHRVLTEKGFTSVITVDVGQENDIRYIDITVEDTHTFFTKETQEQEAVLTHNSQGGIRNASATVNMPIWHYQFDDFIVLKNNQGTEETRVRQLDYCIVLSAFFWRRLKQKGNITFFDPNQVPDLYEAFYRNTERFEKLYEEYEQRKDLRTKVEPAEKVFGWIMKERADTGRYYLLNIDNVSDQGPFDTELHPIYQTNLCTEIMLPTQPFQEVKDAGHLVFEHNGKEISISNLATANLADGTKKLVRFLDENDDVISFTLENGRELIL